MLRWLPALLLFSLPLPALAGTATAQSIWNAGHAIGEAKSEVPKDAKITGTSCNEVDVHEDPRWTCTVTWE